jgi:hypothetical protein
MFRAVANSWYQGSMMQFTRFWSISLLFVEYLCKLSNALLALKLLSLIQTRLQSTDYIETIVFSHHADFLSLFRYLCVVLQRTT